ncbi:hypothetical protein VII00023_06402 [Vibrio ichthyoenteri ATCC 700023]|uniref:Thiol-disulfide oxidoreductase DCC n=1 Tax=Vibrio ichthyoenteri ATCC 700023 TaxID=870968 RepID=F9S1S2_9VIBR|nr:DUF393 domain-containing protein [Vibrio ichthyoenteri]EGU41464.1 hypothetical protein VII00023_06402 [Vibrio ichthyoenteri ATCC 700023]
MMTRLNTDSKPIIFYDGSCLLCVKEMTSLKQQLNDNVIFINILNAIKMEDHPSIRLENSLKILHVIDHTGKLRLGVDANVYLWEFAGQKPLLRLLRWPIFRTIANAGYWCFARYRYPLSRIITGRARCKQCEL